MTQENRLYTRDNLALRRIMNRSQQLDEKLQLLSTQNLASNHQLKTEVERMI